MVEEDRERNEQKECDAEGRETKGEEREEATESRETEKQAERKGTGLLKCRYVGKRSKTIFIYILEQF